MRLYYRHFAGIVIILICGVSNLIAQIKLESTILDTSTVASGLDIPWTIIWGPDNHLWVTERYGRVSRINPENGNMDELITIKDVHQEQESGLLGLVLHPEFNSNPFAYVVYTYKEAGKTKEKVVRYKYSKNKKLSDAKILIENIPAANIHNGSRLLILKDKTMLITTGDAGNSSSAQDLNSLSGKILRINLDGSIPANNPVKGNYSWTFGHRNPQGLAISKSGKLYSSEHGPTSNDEINVIEKGRNYGWPEVNGFCNLPGEENFCNDHNVKEPIFAWTPTIAPCGMAIYENNEISEWKNSILLAVLKEKELIQLKLNESGDKIISEKIYLKNTFGRIRDVCVAPDGSVYIATNGENYTNDSPFTHKIVRIRNNAVSSMNDSGNNESHIVVFNDHQSDTVILKFTEEIPHTDFQIFDASGRLLLVRKINSSETSINKSEFSPGVYLAKVIGKGITYSQKFIIE